MCCSNLSAYELQAGVDMDNCDSGDAKGSGETAGWSAANGYRRCSSSSMMFHDGEDREVVAEDDGLLLLL